MESGCRMKSVVSVRRSSRISRDRRSSFVVHRSCSRQMSPGLDGLMQRLPRPSMAACKPSSISANAWLPTALSWLWTARNARNRPYFASSMARSKRSCLPCGWVSRQRGTDTGRYDYSPTKWWPWKWSMRSATRRSARRSKKRHDQTQDRVLGDSAGARRRVRGLHGRSARNFCGSVRSEASRAVYGRTTGAVAQGNSGADRRDDAAWQACRLRRRTPWHGEHFPRRRTTFGFSPSDRPPPADQGGLGERSRSDVGYALYRWRGGDPRLRQPQHLSDFARPVP